MKHDRQRTPPTNREVPRAPRISNRDRHGRLLRLALAVSFAAVASAAAATEPPQLRLGSDEWPPFTGSPGNERAAIELVHTALDRAGVAATTAISDWKAVERGIRGGELDGSAAIWRTERREKDLVFSEPYLENRMVLVGRSGSDVSARQLTALAGKRVAVVGSYAYGDAVDSAVGVHFVGTRNDQDSLDRLLAGTVDYMLVDELVARHLLDFQSEEVKANLEIGMAPLARRPLHLAIRRDFPDAEDIIAAFNAQILEMLADGSYAQTLRVGWIRVDVDGDGLYELVPYGEFVGQFPPGHVYDVFGDAPAEEAPEKQRVVIGGNIFEGWDAIPEQYKKQGPADVMDDTFKQGTTVVTLKF
jgi:polar amino acid transport system substrate-binding protein